MTEQEIADLVKRVRSIDDALILIESLRASLALCERRAEDAESRVTFYESELVKTAMALAKITDELRALREAGK